MKNILTTIISLFLISNLLIAQTNNLPSTKINDLDNRVVSLNLLDTNSLIVVSFW